MVIQTYPGVIKIEYEGSSPSLSFLGVFVLCASMKPRIGVRGKALVMLLDVGSYFDPGTLPNLT